MNWCYRLIERIPLWLWCFVALTQVISLLVLPFQLPQKRIRLQEMSNDSRLPPDIREVFEKEYERDLFHLKMAGVLTPLSIWIVVRRIRNRRQCSSIAVSSPAKPDGPKESTNQTTRS
jgi:hypothetical protein